MGFGDNDIVKFFEIKCVGDCVFDDDIVVVFVVVYVIDEVYGVYCI